MSKRSDPAASFVPQTPAPLPGFKFTGNAGAIDDDEELVPEPPPTVPSLPAGVQMHDAAMPPQPVAFAGDETGVRKRKDPPPGWQGSFMRCGGCGDFLRGDTCPDCTRDVPAGPQNVMVATPSKVMG